MSFGRLSHYPTTKGPVVRLDVNLVTPIQHKESCPMCSINRVVCADLEAPGEEEEKHKKNKSI